MRNWAIDTVPSSLVQIPLSLYDRAEMDDTSGR